jgi:hypothetical protein
MARRLLAAAVVLAAAAGCVSDGKLVANTTARQYWEEDRYEQRCVVRIGPADCSAQRKDSDELKRQVILANRVQKVGKLPKPERTQLKAQVKKLEAYK